MWPKLRSSLLNMYNCQCSIDHLILEPGFFKCRHFYFCKHNFHTNLRFLSKVRYTHRCLGQKLRTSSVLWHHGFLQLITVAFLLFLAPTWGSNRPKGHSLTITKPKITHHPYIWKYEETHNFGFYLWPKILLCKV